MSVAGVFEGIVRDQEALKFQSAILTRNHHLEFTESSRLTAHHTSQQLINLISENTGIRSQIPEQITTRIEPNLDVTIEL